MNICFLANGFEGVGGIERVSSLLIRQLEKKKLFNIFALSYANHGKTTQVPFTPNVNHAHLFDKPINMKKGLTEGGVIKLRQYLKRNDIDILIVSGSVFYILGVLSTQSLKTKCICWEHSNVLQNHEFIFQKFSRKLATKYADFIVTLNKQDCINYNNIFKPKKIKHIYNPIDNDIFRYTGLYDINSKKIISVGRLTDQKNFETLIEIANEVFKENYDWSWDIYGEGELRESLDRKIKQKGIDNKLVLKGSIPNLYDFYPSYAFQVMTSKYEGFPMTLLEATAFGLPLISFDIPTGPNEIIEDGVNGYLIPAFDKEEFVRKINHLIKDKEQRIKFSNATETVKQNFNIDLITDEWIELFNSFTKDKSF